MFVKQPFIKFETSLRCYVKFSPLLTVKKIIHAVVTSMLDCCNSVLAPSNTSKDAAARMLNRTRMRNHILRTLKILEGTVRPPPKKRILSSFVLLTHILCYFNP